MRIIFISEPLFPLDGTSSRTINFAKALSLEGHEVFIITPKESYKHKKKINDLNIKRLELSIYKRYGLGKIKNFLKFMTRGGIIQLISEIKKLYDPDKPTIIHFVNYYMSIFGLIIEKFLKINTIYDIQASAFLEANSIVSRMITTCIEKICSNAKNLIFITDELKNYFNSRYSIDDSDIYVVPLIMDLNTYTSKSNLRKTLSSFYDFRYLITYHGAPYMSNIDALKRVKLIIDRLNKDGLNCKGLIIGLVGKFVSSPNFITCGYVDNLRSYISVADLALLPFNRGSLGMRVRILDYMSCRIPIIAFYDCLSGYSGALNKKAILASRNINDIIKKAKNILLNPDFSRELVKNAADYLEKNHSPKVISLKLESIYNNII